MQAKIFFTHKSQAVRLPKTVAWSSHIKEVDVVAIGNTRIMTPRGHLWDLWFQSAAMSSDFLESRDQPPLQERS